MDFPIELDLQSTIPIFIQLSQSLKECIITGALKPGAPLPPSRDLAESLGISRGTVIKAYDDLIAQGYLDAITGSGTFVSKRVQVEQALQERLRGTPSAALESSLSKDAKRLMQLNFSHGISGYMEELNYGAPPDDMLPLAQWKECLAKQSRLQQPHHFDCTPETLGHYRLRSEIANYLGRAKGLKCEAEQVVVFNGSQQALNHIAGALIDPGETVVVENPGYGGARDNFLMRDARVVPIDVDRDGLCVDHLDVIGEPVKLVYTSPSHHDPTGAIMSLERRKQLVQWASKKNAILLEDGWDSDYVYAPPAIPSLQSLDNENRVIYLYTFWKLMYPLITIGCAVVPRSLVPVLDRVKFMSERQFPVLEHHAMADFIASGSLERHIKKTKRIYEKRRRALVESLFGAFKTDVEIPKQSASLHICVRFKQSLLDGDLLEAAAQARLPMVSTAPYYVERAVAGEFLIPFAGMSENEIETKIGLMTGASRSLA